LQKEEEDVQMDKKMTRIGLAIVWLISGIVSYINKNYSFLTLSLCLAAFFFIMSTKVD